jgi:hypothetical protein
MKIAVVRTRLDKLTMYEVGPDEPEKMYEE